MVVLLISTNVYAGTVEVGHEETNNDSSNTYASTIKIVDDIEDILSINISYEYGKTDNVVSKDVGSISIGYDPEINERWGLWVVETAGYNNIIGVKYENLFGVGLRYYIFKNDYGKFSISGGVLYHYISDQEEGRYSWRLKYGNDIISAVYYYQPSIEDGNDYIAKFDGSIKVAEYKKVDVKVYYKTEYRSEIDYDYNSSGMKLSIEY